MTDEEFEQLVDEGIKAIPKKFLALLDNVAIVIEDIPTVAQLTKFKLQHAWTLLGLYEGIPQTKRGAYYSALPDKISIFREPIMAQAQGDPEKIKELVKSTVWHEIAHHFGMDEDTVRKAEKKRRDRKEK